MTNLEAEALACWKVGHVSESIGYFEIAVSEYKRGCLIMLLWL